MSYEIVVGDVLDNLPRMAAGSVHCCVTSPPYWGLRDYGVDGQIGLEESPEAFVAVLVAVFREVRREQAWGRCGAVGGEGVPVPRQVVERRGGHVEFAAAEAAGEGDPV